MTDEQLQSKKNIQQAWVFAMKEKDLGTLPLHNFLTHCELEPSSIEFELGFFQQMMDALTPQNLTLIKNFDVVFHIIQSEWGRFSAAQKSAIFNSIKRLYFSLTDEVQIGYVNQILIEYIEDSAGVLFLKEMAASQDINVSKNALLGLDLINSWKD